MDHYLRRQLNAFIYTSDNQLEKNDACILCNLQMCCLLIWDAMSGPNAVLLRLSSISHVQ
jgi:hypothetical protein